MIAAHDGVIAGDALCGVEAEQGEHTVGPAALAGRDIILPEADACDPLQLGEPAVASVGGFSRKISKRRRFHDSGPGFRPSIATLSVNPTGALWQARASRTVPAGMCD